MAVHTAQLHWVTCDACGEPAGDIGCPVEDYRRTSTEAIRRAVEGPGWMHDPATGQLGCPRCTDADEA